MKKEITKKEYKEGLLGKLTRYSFQASVGFVMAHNLLKGINNFSSYIFENKENITSLIGDMEYLNSQTGYYCLEFLASGFITYVAVKGTGMVIYEWNKNWFERFEKDD